FCVPFAQIDLLFMKFQGHCRFSLLALALFVLALASGSYLETCEFASDCAACTLYGFCASCDIRWLLRGGYCYREHAHCMLSKFMCAECHAGCHSCTIPTTLCTSCSSNYYYSAPNTCTPCGPDTYTPENNLEPSCLGAFMFVRICPFLSLVTACSVG